MELNTRTYRDIKDIAKDIKKKLKTELPGLTFSVRIERYAGGQSLYLSLMSAPFEVFDGENKGYAQLNQYALRNKTLNPDPSYHTSNGAHLTPEAWKALQLADKIANAENWDDSDIMTDYFDVNYYFHLSIGRYDKPFKKTA